MPTRPVYQTSSQPNLVLNNGVRCCGH